MRSPSVKALRDAFKLDSRQANLIKRLARAANHPEALCALVAKHCPDTQKYVDRMYSSPFNSHMWRVTVALHAINRTVGGYGVEPLGPIRAMEPPPVEYINMGDTYATTLIYTRATDTLRIGDWGSVAERHPNW